MEKYRKIWYTKHGDESEEKYLYHYLDSGYTRSSSKKNHYQ